MDEAPQDHAIEPVGRKIADAARGRARPKVTANLFGISFGITGLSQAWGSTVVLYGGRPEPSYVLAVLAAAVWAATLISYVEDVRRSGRARSELSDPTFAPFLVLVGIVPMLLGAMLAAHAHLVGVLVFDIFMAVTVAISALLLGQWLVSGVPFERWHPGYFLPTAASGYLSALGCSVLGYDQLAMAMFGYGTAGWLTFGVMPLQRALTPPRLPDPLLPTMAILVAPPVVAGVAWFEINGGRVDAVALGLGGYATVMLLVQLRLAPVFRSAQFSPAWWAFSFTYAAVVADGMRWLSATQAPYAAAWSYLLLAGLTVAIAALAVRTIIAARHDALLPIVATAPSAADVIG